MWSAALLLAALAILAASCTTARKDNASTSGTGSGDTSSTAFGRGVSASTIKIGFSYVDLDALAKAGVVKIAHGPYAEIIKALVDDVNKQGGINGRMLQLYTAKYSPIGNTDQLAACSKLTEDDQVFAVLNGLINDNNLCIVQQHSTALIGGSTTSLSPANMARARAPWASYAASGERSIDALVKVMDKNGALNGHTIGVYAAQTANKPLIDEAVKALKDAGHPAAQTALNDAPDSDLQAVAAQDKVIAQRMMNAHVDTVIDVGQYVPAANFDAAGFHPSLYATDQGNLAAAVFTSPFAKFPIVAGLSASGAVSPEFDTTAFKHCVAVWKQASGQQIKTQPQEDIDGKTSGNVAMQNACTTLQIFVEGAKRAGKNLNNETLTKGIESLGKLAFANGTVGSFGPGKLDAQDEFWLSKFDSSWKQGQGKKEFTPIGQPVVLAG